MFFAISKIFWFLVSPANLLLVCLLVGSLLLWTGWRRYGRGLLTIAALGALMAATLPIGEWMLVKLENRFPVVRSLPERIDGIIVLGGVVDQFVTRDRGQVALSGGVERITEAAAIARNHPEAKFVFSGGSGNLLRPDLPEAGAVGPFLDLLGIDPQRIIIEDKSRNTSENAYFTRALLDPKPGETWILVTSAMHMPRAVGCFRQAGWTVIPYPVDYGFTENEPFQWSFNLGKGLAALNGGIHEWLGLAFYRLTQKSDALFPGPMRG